MAMIKDSTGQGFGVQITSENKMQVNSVSRTITQHVNEIYEKHFSLVFEGIDPVGADDYFFYFENTGTKNIHLTKFRFKSTVIGTVEFHRVTGTPIFAAGVDITPSNRFLGSTKSISAIIKTDTNTTGISVADFLLRLTVSTANIDFVDDAPSHIIVPPGQKFALLWDTSTGVLSGTIDVYEDQGGS